MSFKHNAVNTIRFCTLLHVPLRPDYEQGVETNIARAMLDLAEYMNDGDYHEKLRWILDQVPDTRIDLGLTPYQDGIVVSAVFADDVDATAFKLRWS